MILMLNVFTVLEARMTTSENEVEELKNEVMKLKIENAGKLIISLKTAVRCKNTQLLVY